MSDQTNAVIISIKTQNQTSFVNLKSDNLNLFVIFSLLSWNLKVNNVGAVEACSIRVIQNTTFVEYSLPCDIFGSF